MNKHLRNLNYLAQFVVGIFVLISSANLFAETRQEHVHQMAHSVMPFDMSKTVHIFKMTESGGVQKVITKDPGATDQITLIQQHLQHEAEKVSTGRLFRPGKTARCGHARAQGPSSRSVAYKSFVCSSSFRG